MIQRKCGRSMTTCWSDCSCDYQCLLIMTLWGGRAHLHRQRECPVRMKQKSLNTEIYPTQYHSLYWNSYADNVHIIADKFTALSVRLSNKHTPERSCTSWGGYLWLILEFSPRPSAITKAPEHLSFFTFSQSKINYDGRRHRHSIPLRNARWSHRSNFWR